MPQKLTSPTSAAPSSEPSTSTTAKKIETFEQAEDRLLAVIAKALNFDPIDYKAIADADLTLLATEARDLMCDPPESWQITQAPLSAKILPVGPHEAEGMFLARYEELRNP